MDELPQEAGSVNEVMLSNIDDLNVLNESYVSLLSTQALNDIFNNTPMDDVLDAKYSVDYSKGPFGVETDGESATVGGVIDLGPVEVSVSHDLNTQKTVGKLSLGPKLNTPVGSVKGGVYTDTTGVVGMEAAGSVGNTTIKGNVEASMKSVIDNISDIGAKINNAIRNKFYYK